MIIYEKNKITKEFIESEEQKDRIVVFGGNEDHLYSNKYADGSGQAEQCAEFANNDEAPLTFPFTASHYKIDDDIWNKYKKDLWLFEAFAIGNGIAYNGLNFIIPVNSDDKPNIGTGIAKEKKFTDDDDVKFIQSLIGNLNGIKNNKYYNGTEPNIECFIKDFIKPRAEMLQNAVNSHGEVNAMNCYIQSVSEYIKEYLGENDYKNVFTKNDGYYKFDIESNIVKINNDTKRKKFNFNDLKTIFEENLIKLNKIDKTKKTPVNPLQQQINTQRQIDPKKDDFISQEIGKKPNTDLCLGSDHAPILTKFKDPDGNKRAIITWNVMKKMNIAFKNKDEAEIFNNPWKYIENKEEHTKRKELQIDYLVKLVEKLKTEGYFVEICLQESDKVFADEFKESKIGNEFKSIYGDKGLGVFVNTNISVTKDTKSQICKDVNIMIEKWEKIEKKNPDDKFIIKPKEKRYFVYESNGVVVVNCHGDHNFQKETAELFEKIKNHCNENKKKFIIVGDINCDLNRDFSTKVGGIIPNELKTGFRSIGSDGKLANIDYVLTNIDEVEIIANEFLDAEKGRKYKDKINEKHAKWRDQEESIINPTKKKPSTSPDKTEEKREKPTEDCKRPTRRIKKIPTKNKEKNNDGKDTEKPVKKDNKDQKKGGDNKDKDKNKEQPQKQKNNNIGYTTVYDNNTQFPLLTLENVSNKKTRPRFVINNEKTDDGNGVGSVAILADVMIAVTAWYLFGWVAAAIAGTIAVAVTAAVFFSQSGEKVVVKNNNTAKERDENIEKAESVAIKPIAENQQKTAIELKNLKNLKKNLTIEKNER